MAEPFNMYNVAQILSPEFERTWPESVAVVQEAAAMLHSGLGLPDPEDLLLNDAGTLSLGFGSESGQHPVVSLATLLEKLLQGTEAPESLLALANENSSENPKHNTVEGFSRALAFYERPNRATDLKGLVGRLGNRPIEREAADLEFERLRDKVGGKLADENKAAETEQRNRRIPKLTPFQQQIAAAGIIIAVLLSIVAIKGSPEKRIEAGYEGLISGMSGVISGLLNSFGMSAPASAAPPVASGSATATGGNAEPLEKPAEKSAATRAARSAPVTTQTRNATGSSKAVLPENGTSGTTPPSPVAPAVMTPGLASRSLSPPTVRAEPATVSPVVPPLAPAVPPSPSAPSVVPSNGVYSPETPGISPPVLVRPQMPREPAPGDDTGYFDMIVDEQGLVEQVKLISPRRRYHDRMLVAAAKAWQFKPASLNGQRVRYRILIPIILSGQPY